MARVKSDKTCPFCKIEHEIDIPVTEEKFLRDLWKVRFLGEKIQDVLNYINEDSREILLTGYCTKGWDGAFHE